MRHKSRMFKYIELAFFFSIFNFLTIGDIIPNNQSLGDIRDYVKSFLKDT